MDLGERADKLARNVIAPLVLGGALVLDRPLGRELALELARERRIVDDELRSEIELARLRVARGLAPVDALDELSEAQWLMAAALHDLLQVTNRELSTFASRGRHEKLLAETVELCAAIPRATTVREALGRHATYARVLGLFRRDTTVRWWTGSAVFRGQKPPARLLAWPGLRRVGVSERRVVLAQMAEDDVVPVSGEQFRTVLAGWLSLSPLTDLATANREAPAFAWTEHSLSLVATIAGSDLALRAHARATGLAGTEVAAAIKAMQDSASALQDSPAAHRMAQAFAEGLGTADSIWSEAAGA